MHKVYRFRYHLIPLILLAGILSWSGFEYALQADNSLQAWFIKDDPALEAYYEFQESFGNDELVFLVYEGQGESIRLEEMRSLADLEVDLEKHPDVKEVLSPLDLNLPPRNAFEMQGPAWIDLDSETKTLSQQIEKQSFFKDQFFSPEKRGVKMIIQFELGPHFEEKRTEILQEIYAITHAQLRDEQTFFGGLSVIYEAMNSLSKKDFTRFLGVGYLLMFLLIGILYRSWRYIIYALGTIFLSTYFTLALYGLMGNRMNLLSTLIPAIIILLCVMDVMHILNERNREDAELSLRERALNSLKRIWKPCLFTSLSTMAGFLSLAISPVQILASFGIYAAVGIALGLLFSFWLGTIILTVSQHPHRDHKSAAALGRLQDWVLSHPYKVLVVFVGLILGSVWYIPQLEVDTKSIEYLPEDHKVREDSRKIEALMGPYMPLEFLVKPTDSLSMKSPEILAGLSRLAKKAESLEHTGQMQSYHLIYEAAFKQRYGEDWQRGFEKEGVMREIARQAERIAPEWVRSFNSEHYKIGRFALSGELISAAELEKIISAMEDFSQAEFGYLAEVKVSGYQSLYGEIVNYVTRSQVRSLSLAIVLVFLLLWLFLRNLRLSLISLLPNLFPILMMLSAMAAFDIALDTATASIASIVLSFSIDDTMHFIWHYQKLKRQGLSLDQARRKTIAHVGRAILFTSMVLLIGYSLMVFGELKTVEYFGFLTALSIVAALMSQFLLFPILLKNYDRPIAAEQTG